jgi:hypothetical protein
MYPLPHWGSRLGHGGAIEGPFVDLLGVGPPVRSSFPLGSCIAAVLGVLLTLATGHRCAHCTGPWALGLGSNVDCSIVAIKPPYYFNDWPTADAVSGPARWMQRKNRYSPLEGCWCSGVLAGRPVYGEKPSLPLPITILSVGESRCRIHRVPYRMLCRPHDNKRYP